MMNANLNSRFSVYFVVLTIIIIISLSSILLFQFRNSTKVLVEDSSLIFSEKLQESLFKHGESIVTILAENLTNPVYQLDIQTIYELLVPVLKSDNVISVVVYDELGIIIHDGNDSMPQYGKILADQKTIDNISLHDHVIRQLEKEDTVVSVSRSIWIGDEPLGGVKVQMNLSGVMQSMAEIRQRQSQLEKKDSFNMRYSVLITALIFIIISIFLSIELAIFLTRPIQALAAQAIEIGQGKFSEMKEVESHDEIGTLINSFAKMSIDLKTSVMAREEAEEKLIERERLSALGQIAGTVAHDFNNLLTIITGNLRLLMETPGGSNTENEKKMMDSALTAAETGAQLTRGLLSVSRKQILHPEDIDVNKFLDEFIAFASRILGVNVQIQLNASADPYFVHVDARQLQNALFNLAINSKDAMPDGGKITLDVKRETLGDDTLNREILNEDNVSSTHQFVIISLTDTGTGMSSDLLKRVHEPFFTTKSVGKGTGLGLSAVNEFAKQSNGKIDIKSTLGQGTSISIFLPLAHHTKSDAEEKQSAVPELVKGSETILVTDDEPMVRMVGMRMLNSLGYHTLEAENADAAIKIMESDADIDLLFSDIIMPGSLDGHGLSKWVKEHRPDIKIVLTSGYYEVPDANDTNPEIYLLPVLPKPYSILKLASRIRNELDK